MKPITKTEAVNKGLRPVTEADRATAPVETSEGKIMYKRWCIQEAARFRASKRDPHLVTEEGGKVALWALPPPPPPKEPLLPKSEDER